MTSTMRSLVRIIAIPALCLFWVSQLVFPQVALQQTGPRSVKEVIVTGQARPSSGKHTNDVTQEYDTSRTGANLNETVLNTSNVNPGQFGKLFTRSVDGFIYAQPLVISDLSIPGKGTYNVVFVATEHNSVYAYDADDPSAASPLWHVYLGTPVLSTDIAPDYLDLTPEVGITSTPVIDAGSGTIYVVAKSKDGSGYHQRLHALDLTSGREKLGGPVDIRASTQGSGAGSASGRV